MPPTKPARSNSTGSSLGFEAKLWLAADKLRNNMDAAEYKHVVLGLIFLKYISDSFEEHRAKLVAGEGDYAGANPEDPDEYRAENIFWVPKESRWSFLQANAKQPTIGKLVDDAMDAIEKANEPKDKTSKNSLKGILPKDYARPALDKQRLGELIDLIGTIVLTAASEGEKTHRSVDLLGRVYEYFLTRFASAEGKNGGQFYTPSCVVRCLVEMLAPYKGRIYDPACGSGGMFVQSEKFVEAHGGKLGDISIYGQESNATTRRLAVMNLALRGIEADFGPEHADTFRRDLHPDLRADYVLANPPFNDSDWFRKDDDVRWQFGVPPKGNANFAWVQHFIHHLAPQGMAGFVLANGSMSSNQSGEGEIRRALIEADLVDCMVALSREASKVAFHWKKKLNILPKRAAFLIISTRKPEGFQFPQMTETACSQLESGCVLEETGVSESEILADVERFWAARNPRQGQWQTCTFAQVRSIPPGFCCRKFHKNAQKCSRSIPGKSGRLPSFVNEFDASNQGKQGLSQPIKASSMYLKMRRVQLKGSHVRRFFSDKNGLQTPLAGTAPIFPQKQFLQICINFNTESYVHVPNAKHFTFWTGRRDERRLSCAA